MTHYGKIKNYDTDKGAGTITPEAGGDTIAFAKSGLQADSAAPQIGQRFGYETEDVVGGVMRAVNVRQDERKPASAKASN